MRRRMDSMEPRNDVASMPGITTFNHSNSTTTDSNYDTTDNDDSKDDNHHDHNNNNMAHILNDQNRDPTLGTNSMKEDNMVMDDLWGPTNTKMTTISLTEEEDETNSKKSKDLERLSSHKLKLNSNTNTNQSQHQQQQQQQQQQHPLLYDNESDSPHLQNMDSYTTTIPLLSRRSHDEWETGSIRSRSSNNSSSNTNNNKNAKNNNNRIGQVKSNVSTFPFSPRIATKSPTSKQQQRRQQLNNIFLSCCIVTNNNDTNHPSSDTVPLVNTASTAPSSSSSFPCPCSSMLVRSTLSHMMQLLAKVLFWCTVLSTVSAIGWYSYELKNNGTDPHLIAWFSAGAFVLLGFPISMYGIVMHLANYNQPNVQMYIVRILWMVPIYSMESWLCLRFHRYAIYIEALRDVYESYVLYSFLQFLIQVLGGEEELILMLKDKSPTRGVHMWGLQWCLKPWLMGQPVSSTTTVTSTMTATKTTTTLPRRTPKSNNQRSVQWTSPFYVKCKFGVLQYVLLKFVSSIFVMTLELNDMYKEGDFRLTSGYLYICVVTNFSQCWALYCLIFFYHATKNELSPIRPVAKFISVKALVFFTWWQSLFISIIYQMNLIPHYHASNESEWTSEDVAKGLQDYLICIEMFIGAIVHVFVFPHTDYLPEAVQARQQSLHPTRNHPKRQLGRRHPLSAVVSIHNNNDCSSSVTSKNSELDVPLSNTTTTTVVKSHYPQLVSAVAVSSCHTWQTVNGHDDDKDEENGTPSLPSSSLDATNVSTTTSTTVVANSKNTMSGRQDIKKRDVHPSTSNDRIYYDDPSDSSIPNSESEELPPLVSSQPKTGFVKALIDSTIPRDILDQSVGIVKGDYVVEKKSLLSHAATSDAYELFSSSRRQHYWNSNNVSTTTATATTNTATATTTTTAKKSNKDG